MLSRIKTGEGVESQLAATTTKVLQQKSSRFDQNYGTMTIVMNYLPTIEQLKMQGLDKWQYITGVGRVQVHFEMQKMFYFADESSQILTISETGECQRFNCRGESNFSNERQISCQVGRSRLFQAHRSDSSFRILLIDPSQRSFTVEKSGAMSEAKKFVNCLANFQDQFIFLFLFGQNQPARRYSLAGERLEELPPPVDSNRESACSLGDKVYSFAYDYGKNSIHVLHNPGASISSQELQWQVIEAPANIFEPRSVGTAFVPLNSTEIAILGGRNACQYLGDIITFNTSTCEFKKEMEDETNTFMCQLNQSAKVYENAIVVLMYDQDQGRCLIKYNKGDTCINNLHNCDDSESSDY